MKTMLLAAAAALRRFAYADGGDTPAANTFFTARHRRRSPGGRGTAGADRRSTDTQC
jgi:hypothetical protein